MSKTLDLFAHDLLRALRPFGVGIVLAVKGSHPSIFAPAGRNEYDEWSQWTDPTMPPKRKRVWVLSTPLR